MYKIYTKEDCIKCDEAKQYLKNKNKDFLEYVVGRDITIEEFKQEFPRISILPVVTFNDLRFASLEEIE